MEASEERTYLLALTYLFRNRLRREHELLNHYGSAVEVWKNIQEEKQKEALEKAKEEEAFIHKHGISVHTMYDATYPYRLKECPDAPILLYGKGKIDANRGKMVSIVGTRSCTERGKELTHKLVQDLAHKLPNITIVSGLAYGIDVEAHKAALEMGIPTLIITGHGMDRIYPAYHRNIAVAALQNGGILTEYMSGTTPERQNFVARDRIIAGMADAVVVVESKEKGGSLITAHMACDYARSLFAFPGRVQDDTSRGCNRLIRDQKAALIESADDLIEAMMWQDDTRQHAVQTELIELDLQLSEQEQKIVHLLRSAEDGVHVNSIVMELGMEYAGIVSTLTMLEMKRIVKGLPGGIYKSLK